jgi:N-acetylglucosaminyldiphosphoundecaprenol N-acetyl-beta-D-mannosaminyltransferase
MLTIPVPVAAPEIPTAEPASRLPVSVMGVPLDSVTAEEALARIDAMIASGEPHYVVTPNVDFLVQARSDEELHRILCEADLVLCDGQPLVWASRWLGNPLPGRVAGSDLAPRLVAQAAQRGHRIFLLGATPEANERAAQRLRAQHPDLQLVGWYSPPFRPLDEMENEEIVCRIRAAEPDILVVGFGCPKQEKWIARHYRALGVPVCLGLGGTIDFLAGRVSRAPHWMRRAGLEWTYRMMLEPRRLARRYWHDLRHFATAIVSDLWTFAVATPVGRGTVAMRRTAGWLDVRVTGVLDRTAIERADGTWRRMGTGPRGCRVDLAAVEFVDSTALALLTHWHRRLRRQGRRLVLCRPSVRVRQLLRHARLGHFETSELSPA